MKLFIIKSYVHSVGGAHIPLRKTMLMRVIATSNPLIKTPDMFAYVDITSPDGAT